MTWLIMVFILGLAVLAQAVAPGPVWLGQVRFPWLMGVVLYYAMDRQLYHGLLAALMAGLLQDAMTPFIPMGYSALCFMATALAGWGVSRFIASGSAAARMLTGGFTGGGLIVGLYLLLVRRGLVEVGFWMLAWKVFGGMVLGALCTVIMGWLLARLDKLAGNLEMEQVYDGI